MTGATEVFGGRFLRNAALSWTIFIVYGSLVPFELRPGGVEVAWQQVEGWRALAGARGLDWAINLLLGIPLAFCVTGAISLRDGGPRLRAVCLGLLACLMVSSSVECAQVFFAGRVPSLADAAAQLAGAVAGVGLWLAAGRPLLGLLAAASRPGEEGLRAGMALAVTAYVLYALFPFDVILPGREALAHFTRPGTVALLPEGEGLGLRFALLSAVKLLVFMPLGAMLALDHRRAAGGLATAVLLGLLVSGALFGARTFLLASGSDTLWSFMLRWAGVPAGYVAWRRFQALDVPRLVAWLRATAMLAVPIYLVLLAGAKGVLPPRPPSAAELSAIVQQLSWLPFFYGFSASSTRAVASFGAVFVLFVPVGIVLRLFARGGTGLVAAALAGAVASVLLEAAGLILAGLRPDPSNPVIAAVAAAFGAAIVPWFIESSRIHLLNVARRGERGRFRKYR